MAESEQKLRVCSTSDSFYRISKLELLPAITIRLRIPACITLWVLGLFALIGLHKNFQWTTITICLEENPDMHFFNWHHHPIVNSSDIKYRNEPQ